jgi:hypothetical protein
MIETEGKTVLVSGDGGFLGKVILAHPGVFESEMLLK